MFSIAVDWILNDNMESLQTRWLKCHLKMCYKIIHNEIGILSGDFFVFSKLTHTRGHNYYLRAVPGSIHISISFQIVLFKSGMLCLVQW